MTRHETRDVAIRAIASGVGQRCAACLLPINYMKYRTHRHRTLQIHTKHASNNIITHMKSCNNDHRMSL